MCCCSGAREVAVCAPGCFGPQHQYQALWQCHSWPLAQSAAAPGGPPAGTAPLCPWEKCPSTATRFYPDFRGLHFGEEHIGRYVDTYLIFFYWFCETVILCCNVEAEHFFCNVSCFSGALLDDLSEGWGCSGWDFSARSCCFLSFIRQSSLYHCSPAAA